MRRRNRESSADGPLPRLLELAELERLVRTRKSVYIRYSEGPERDAKERSIDAESGLELPGLSVNPLDPQKWWTRPLAEWLARQINQYRHLAEQNPDRFAWVLTGREVARGPDCEPLIADVIPLARLADGLLDEALELYRERFDAGRGPED